MHFGTTTSLFFSIFGNNNIINICNYGKHVKKEKNVYNSFIFIIGRYNYAFIILLFLNALIIFN